MPPSAFPYHELSNCVLSPHRGGAAGIAESETRRMYALAALINEGREGEREGWGNVQGMGNRLCVKKGY